MEKLFEIACGSFEAMKMIKEKGFKGLNPKTHKYQIVDKNTKYEIEKHKDSNILFILKSNKNLIKIAEDKGLIV